MLCGKGASARRVLRDSPLSVVASPVPRVCGCALRGPCGGTPEPRSEARMIVCAVGPCRAPHVRPAPSR